MDLFKNILQPTIIHLGKNNSYRVSNQYFLNYNVVQIDWFINNSLILEDNSGIVLLEYTDTNNPYSASANDMTFLLDDDNIHNDKTVLDIPRIYFVINDKFLNENNDVNTPASINEFIIALLQLSDNESNSIISDYITNGDLHNNLIPGEDYFINKTFADYLIEYDLKIDDEDAVEENSDVDKLIKLIRSIELPNYLDNSGNIQLPWVKLSENEIDNTKLSYYYTLNKYSKYDIDDDSLRNFYVTFINAILEANSLTEIITLKDALYKAVMEYFVNGKNDCGLNLINLVLGSTYTGQQINTGSSFCACNTYINNDLTTSCADLYINAMLEHLKQMLGDIDFYYKWMFKDGKPNSDLIDLLKYLIILLKDRGFTLTDTVYNFCKCPTTTNIDQEKHNKILDNYIKVLEFINECKIQQNVNKIKLWGSQFAELLPKLDF